MVQLRRYFYKKGQGIVEYALLLAAVVAIAMAVTNNSIGSSIRGILDGVVIQLGGGQQTTGNGNSYASYFSKWRDKSSAWLAENVSQEERLQADQEALGIIARAFIGKNEEGVKELISLLSLDRRGNPQFENAAEKNYKAGNDGWSNTLVALSYRENNLDNDPNSNTHYIHLDWSGNVDTVQLLTEDVKATKGIKDGVKPPSDFPYDNTKNSGVSDRIFYSDAMINTDNSSASNKMVTLQVHYEKGVVDQVQIQARDVTAGHSDQLRNAKKNEYPIIQGLDLTVTDKTITPVN